MREIRLRKRRLSFPWVVTLATALLPAIGYAHPGHGATSAFQAGLLHPWTGLDHVALMLVVGLWATLMRNQSIPAMLCATAVGIIAGSGLGVFAVGLPFGEQITVASVIVIGMFATAAGQVRKPFAATLVALFCMFHGYVHLAEAPEGSSQLAFSSGFLISMVALQLAGAVIGVFLSKREVLARTAGACCSAFGLLLLVAG